MQLCYTKKMDKNPHKKKSYCFGAQNNSFWTSKQAVLNFERIGTKF